MGRASLQETVDVVIVGMGSRSGFWGISDCRTDSRRAGASPSKIPSLSITRFPGKLKARHFPNPHVSAMNGGRSPPAALLSSPRAGCLL